MRPKTLTNKQTIKQTNNKLNFHELPTVSLTVVLSKLDIIYTLVDSIFHRMVVSHDQLSMRVLESAASLNHLLSVTHHRLGADLSPIRLP